MSLNDNFICIQAESWPDCNAYPVNGVWGRSTRDRSGNSFYREGNYMAPRELGQLRDNFYDVLIVLYTL